jgi:hypothetical protein
MRRQTCSCAPWKVLLEIAASLEGISPTSAFWSEAHSANAELPLGGWRFEYRIHRRDRRILVVGARQLGSQAHLHERGRDLSPTGCGRDNYRR